MGKWLNGLSKIQNPTLEQVPKVTKGTFGTSGTALPQEYPEIKRWPAVGEPEIIWAVDLLAKKPAAEVCRCCGKVAWWTKASGQRVCGVCHPDPRRKTRQAA